MNTCFRLPPFLIESMATSLLAIADGRDPDQTLGPDDDPYLRRWFIERSRETGNVYLHNTLRSDADPELHDHPWANVSIGLRETVVEEVPDGERTTTRLIRPGDVMFREATDRHRLHIAKPTWTLFVTGPKVREWGFHHADGWMHNQDFFRLRGYF